MVEKLESCPFCGAVPQNFDGDFRVDHKANCFMTLGQSFSRWIVGSATKAAWNRRHP